MKYEKIQVTAIGFAVVLVVTALLLSARETMRNAQVAAASESAAAERVDVQPKMQEYIEITASCGPHFDGECVNIRSGPGTEYPAVGKSRNGMVLLVSKKVTNAEGDWYKIAFDEWLRYPERQSGDRYISAEFVRAFQDIGPQNISASTTPTTKHMLVDRSEQKLYAYDGDTLFMQESVSTGLDDMPTPRGTFHIYRKTPTRYMQGPIPGVSDQEYDLPGVPWNLYFTEQGAVIHGAYWHDHFGSQWSHGCVNLPADKAQQLYYWADLGTTVTVRD